MERRKIVEIYAEENEEEGITYFDTERCENSMTANAVMKMLLNTFRQFEGEEVEVKYEGRED